MEIYKDLESLGFTTNESKVYLTLLKVGPSLAGRISKESNLDRSSTYNALKLLVRKGIVSMVHETKRTIYSASDPKKILNYIKEKEEIANKIIPDLKKQYSIKKEKKNVTLYQGYKGIKTIYEDILNSLGKGEENLVMGAEGQFSDKMKDFSLLFRKLKLEKGFKTKLLVRKGIGKSTKGKKTEYRQIPTDVASPSTITLYKNKVGIIIWEENPEAILIENDGVSKSMKSYFDFIWRHAKKLK